VDLGLFFLCVSGWCPVRKIVRERAEGMDRCVKCVFSSPGQVHSNSLQVGKSLLVYCLTSPFLTLNFFFFWLFALEVLYLPIAASLLYYTLPVYLDIIFLHNIFFLSLSHDTTHSYSLFSFLFFPFSGVRFTARYVKVSFFFFFFSKYLFISGVYSSFLFVKFPHFFPPTLPWEKIMYIDMSAFAVF
jgi:hypothetical protein